MKHLVWVSNVIRECQQSRQILNGRLLLTPKPFCSWKQQYQQTGNRNLNIPKSIINTSSLTIRWCGFKSPHISGEHVVLVHLLSSKNILFLWWSCLFFVIPRCVLFSQRLPQESLKSPASQKSCLFSTARPFGLSPLPRAWRTGGKLSTHWFACSSHLEQCLQKL